MMSIRSQTSLVFAMVLVPLLVTAAAIVVASRSVVSEARTIFDDSVRLEEIDRGLLEADQHLRDYLDLRTAISLSSYFQSVDQLQRATSTLPGPDAIGNRDISYLMVRRLVDRYLESTAAVVAAGRGRLVADYTRLYRESARLRELTSLHVSSLYWEDIDSSLQRFTEVSGLLNRLAFESGITLIVVAVLAVLSIGFLTRRVAQPIAELSRRAHSVADGAFDLPDFRLDHVAREIADLGASFDVMKHSVKKSIDDLNKNAHIERELMEKDISVLRMRSSLRSAQLLALQSHINPHFLYNTLNTGVQLAVVEGAHRTTEYLERFGVAVRSLLADSTAPVTLAHEFETLENYMYVMKVRFGDRIRFRTALADDAREFMIPPLILQPLVENSITHGLRDVEREGLISVSAERGATRRPDRLIITVADNGSGMAKDQLARLLHGEHHEQHKPGPEEGSERGIGVANVVERLRLFYGVADVCTVDATPGSGTTITFMLPIAPEIVEESVG